MSILGQFGVVISDGFLARLTRKFFCMANCLDRHEMEVNRESFNIFLLDGFLVRLSVSIDIKIKICVRCRILFCRYYDEIHNGN